MKPSIGLITIGQSPRVDITPDLMKIWQDKVNVMETGVLDDLTEKEILNLKPYENETLLVSRLRNGESAKLAEERIIPILQEKIFFLEKKVDLIFLMCTGEFSEIQAKVPLIQPDTILRNTVKGLLKNNQTLGVLVPNSGQVEDMKKIWPRYIDNKIVVEAGSPYGTKVFTEIENGANELMKKGADVIVLDCMGYSNVMKTEVIKLTQKPVILPRTLIARLICELLGI